MSTMGGVLQVVPHKVPANTLEAAEQSLEVALTRLDIAMVEVRGARTRLQMIRDHEAWKLAQGSTT